MRDLCVAFCSCMDRREFGPLWAWTHIRSEGLVDVVNLLGDEGAIVETDFVDEAVEEGDFAQGDSFPAAS